MSEVISMKKSKDSFVLRPRNDVMFYNQLINNRTQVNKLVYTI